MKILTEVEYIKKQGAVCPVCKSNDIEGGFVEIDNQGATQKCSCLNCNSTWLDTYRLTGFEHLEIND